jgi:hypothetical protein
MKKFTVATIAVSGLAAAILGLAAPADAAPTGRATPRTPSRPWRPRATT